MGAYELADKLDWVCENHLIAIGDADFKATANMLRHQADYIAQLEKGLDSSIAMNKAQAERQVKELTDEEIDEVAQALIDDCSYCSLHFARAILRKAQEK
jgi:hypothetical protein